MAFQKTLVTCTETDLQKAADILSKSDKVLEVAIQGTQEKLVMSRTDVRKPYVGTKYRMEFISDGEVVDETYLGSEYNG